MKTRSHPSRVSALAPWTLFVVAVLPPSTAAGCGAAEPADANADPAASSSAALGDTVETVEAGVSQPSADPGDKVLLSYYRPAFASSYESASYLASKAVDGNEKTTRWSSRFTDNEWIAIDLGAPCSITGVSLYWENASAKEYLVQVSDDGERWTSVASKNDGTWGPRLDEFTGLSATGRYVRMLGIKRASGYGYSLYELNVFGRPPATPRDVRLTNPSTPVSASSTEGPFVAANAVDASHDTRWGSAWSGNPAVDNQWISVDLGSQTAISSVYLEWETAYGKDYEVQVSADNVGWTTVKTITNGDGRNDLVTNLNASGRYLRIHGLHRGTGYGYSLFDLQVYGPRPASFPSPVSLRYRANDTTNDAAIRPQFEIVNGGDDAVYLPDLHIDYYLYEPLLTAADLHGRALSFGAGATTDVKVECAPLDPISIKGATKANIVCHTGFTGWNVIAPQASTQLALEITAADGRVLDETDDYSRLTSATYALSKTIVLYSDTAKAIVQGAAPVGDTPAVPPFVNTGFVDALVARHAASYRDDPRYQAFADNVCTFADTAPTLIPADAAEAHRIYYSGDNSETFLADIICSRLTGTARHYPDTMLAPSAGYLTGSFGYSRGLSLVNDLKRDVENLLAAVAVHAGCPPFAFICKGVTGLVMINKTNDARKAGNALSDWQRSMAGSALEPDKIMLGAAEYLQNMALVHMLSPASPTLPSQFSRDYQTLVDFMSTLYNDNNIIIKSYAAIALYDILNEGTARTLPSLNRGIEKKFTVGGGYGEGTHYLQYTLEQVAPLYYFGAAQGFFPRKESPAGSGQYVLEGVSPKVLASAEWLRTLAGQDGIVPAADDGNADIPWLAPFGFLTGDETYRQFTAAHVSNLTIFPSIGPDNEITTLTPVKFLTYVLGGYHVLARPTERVLFSEGVGKMRFSDHAAGQQEVAILAEEGQLLTAGASHDRQDHLSVTLRRFASGVAKPDVLIWDPGYGGFADREQGAVFANHNVPMLGVPPVSLLTPEQKLVALQGGVVRNGTLTFDEAANIVKDKFGDPFLNGLLGIGLKFQDVFPLATREFIQTIEVSSGGGASRCTAPFNDGMQCSLTYDAALGSATRTVVDFDGDLVIADAIRSNAGMYAVHFNLPAIGSGDTNPKLSQNQWVITAKQPGDSNLYDLVGNSKVRLSVYSQDDETMVSSDPADATLKGRYPMDGSTPLLVSSIRFENIGSGAAYTHDYFNYLSIVEGTDVSAEFRAPYEWATDVTGAVVALRRSENGGTTRYAFTSLLDDAAARAIVIEAMPSVHGRFETDAAFGVVQFDNSDGHIVSLRLLGVTRASLDGTPVSF